MDKDETSTPGKRLKYVRALLRLSRGYIEKKYNIPAVTLKSWESEATKLTKSGADRCVEVYLNEGLITNADWFLEGVGLNPKKKIDIAEYFLEAETEEVEIACEDDEICMIREANLFKESYKNAVIMLVSNDDMRPFFKPGDYVGGRLRYGADIETAVNRNCIVLLNDGSKFFRKLVKDIKGKYNLMCLNPNEYTGEPVMYDVKIESVAPVVWHRIKDNFS